MATMRKEVYDKLHPLLEQLVDITCDRIEALEERDQPEREQFNMERVIEQLEDYGKYKGILCIEKDGESDNFIPVSIAKQIVKGRGLGGVLGYIDTTDKNCSTCKNNVEFPPPHTCDICTSLDQEEEYEMWEPK